MFKRIVVLLALMASGAASAQTLPRIAEFYFDADANTVRPVIAVKETGDAAVQRLLKKIEREPYAKAEHAQLAHMAMARGQEDVGREYYTRALARLDRNDVLWRAVMWNYGWDLFRAGDAQGAFVQWSTLQSARGFTASWMPPTNALVLWTLGRKDEAVQWYAAAVRTEPTQWRSPDAFARLLPEWTQAERDTLAQVQAAWAANPPAWPPMESTP